MRPFSTYAKINNGKKSDKQQQTQNIKDPILEALQDTISILKTELVHKQKTIDTLILITEKITTGPSNVQAWLTPFEEREEPEEQHQHEFQFHQEDLTRHQQLDTRQDEMQQQHVNQEHSQHKQQQHQTQEQQLTRSEELLQQLHQQVQEMQQEMQKLQQRNPCNHQSQPVQEKHANVGTVSNEKRNIVIFGDSISKGINRKILGQKLFNAKVFYRFFPGATSRDFFHYIKPTLQDPQTNFDIAVLHMGDNDIVSLGSTTETVSNSILHIANQCRNNGVKEVSISSVTYTTLLNSDLINDVNNTQ